MKDFIIDVLFGLTIIGIIAYLIAFIVCAMHGQNIINWGTYFAGMGITIFWFSVFAFGN